MCMPDDYSIITDTAVPADVADEIARTLRTKESRAIETVSVNRFDEREMGIERTCAMRHIADPMTPVYEMRERVPFERRRDSALTLLMIAADYDGVWNGETDTGNAVALRSLATELAELCLDIYIGMPEIHYAFKSDGDIDGYVPRLQIDGEEGTYRATERNLGIDGISSPRAKELIEDAFTESDDRPDVETMHAVYATVMKLGCAYSNAVRRKMIGSMYKASSTEFAPFAGSDEIMTAAKKAITAYMEYAPRIGSLGGKETRVLVDRIVEIMSDGVEKADAAVSKLPA